MWVIKFNIIELTCSSMFLNALLSPFLPQVVIVLLLPVKTKNKTKQNKKNKIDFKLCCYNTLRAQTVWSFPHVTNFLLISTIFLVQWNLNGIKFLFLMISRYFCSTKTLTLSIFFARSVHRRKAQTGYTALIEAPTHEIQNTQLRPDHNTGNSYALLFSSPTNHITLKMQETGPKVYRPYPRRLERLTIYRCHYKGSTFSSVI